MQPLGFFSKKFDNAQRRYSTYDRELTAVYIASASSSTRVRVFYCECVTAYADDPARVASSPRQRFSVRPRAPRQRSGPHSQQPSSSIRHVPSAVYACETSDPYQRSGSNQLRRHSGKPKYAVKPASASDIVIRDTPFSDTATPFYSCRYSAPFCVNQFSAPLCTSRQHHCFRNPTAAFRVFKAPCSETTILHVA